MNIIKFIKFTYIIIYIIIILIIKFTYILISDVSLEILSLLILPYLFQPCNVKTGNKKKWKPSKAEVAESFICRIPVSKF